jgi:hypothetical protein
LFVVSLVVTVIVLMSMFGRWAMEREREKPIKYQPVLQGRWENADGFVEFGHGTAFTMGAGGKTVEGTYVPWNDGEYTIETKVGGVTRKERLRCVYDEQALTTTDEAGKKTVYHRKPER